MQTFGHISNTHNNIFHLYCLAKFLLKIVCLFEALRYGQQFFGMASWVKPVLSNGDEVSSSRTHHHAPGGDRNPQPCYQESDALPTELSVLPAENWKR